MKRKIVSMVVSEPGMELPHEGTQEVSRPQVDIKRTTGSAQVRLMGGMSGSSCKTRLRDHAENVVVDVVTDSADIAREAVRGAIEAQRVRPDRVTPSPYSVVNDADVRFPTKKLLINADHDVKIPGSWVSREVDERKLVEHLTHDGTQVIELSMMGGSGKSTCIRNLIDELDKTYGVKYEQVIWYAFYHLRSQDVFTPLKAFLEFVIEKAKLEPGRTTQAKKEIVMNHLQRHKILVVLDGLEIAQKGGRTDDEKIIPVRPGEEGEFKDPGFRDFVLDMTKQKCSEVIVTTRLPMKEVRLATGELMRGVVQVGLGEWGDDEVKEYLGGVSQEEDIYEIIRVLGKHPLTMAVFKGMVRKKPEMDVGGFLRVTETTIGMGGVTTREDSYVKQCHRIQRMIKELKQVLTEEEIYFMEQVGLMYGSVDYKDSELTRKGRLREGIIRGWWVGVTSSLSDMGLIKPDEKKERIAAHPMVKVGFRALMGGDEKIRRRGEIMEYYEGKSRRRRQGALLDMDGMMEWGHQLTKIIDEGGEGRLDELYQRHKVEMRQLEYSELGRKIKGEMGELITERRRIDVGKRRDVADVVKDDPEREEVFEEELGTIRRKKELETREVSGVRVEGRGALSIVEEREGIVGMHFDVRAILFGLLIGRNLSESEKKRISKDVEEKKRRAKRLKEKAEVVRDKLFGADMKDVSRWGEIYGVCLEGKELIREMAEEGLESEINKLGREMAVVVGYSVYVRTLYQTEREQRAERIRELMGEQFTGVEEWEEIFEEIPEGIPELSEELVTWLEQTCPFDGVKKVHETHVMCFIPQRLRGTKLSIEAWKQEMVEEEHKGKKKGGLYEEDWYDKEEFTKKTVSRFAEQGITKPDKGVWILMPKKMVPGSTNKRWEEQEELVGKRYRREGYEIPSALEVVSGVMVHYLRTGERLYGERYKIDTDDIRGYPYVTTKDYTSSGYHVVVGCFDNAGLSIPHWADTLSEFVGVAAVRRFA